MAARDGEMIAAPDGCCPGLTVELGVGKINVHHDDECDALNERAAGHVPARLISNAAAARVLADRGIRPTIVVIRR